MLINLIEDYNVRLLSTKVFWDDLSKEMSIRSFGTSIKRYQN